MQTINRLLHRREVEARVGLSRSAIYRQMRAGTFPCPVRVGPKAVRWSAAEIEAWLASRPRAEGEHQAA